MANDTILDTRFAIYRIVDTRRPNDVVYVGQTVRTLRKRTLGHLYEAKRGGRYRISRWIKKTTDDGGEPIIELVEAVAYGSSTALNEREVYWIARYRAEGHKLQNQTDGGNGIYGFTVTAEVRAQISATHKGKPKSREHRAKLALAGKRRVPVHMTIETKAKISAALKGRPKSAAQVAKMAASMAGRKSPSISIEGRARISAAAKKRGPVPHTPESKAKMRAAWAARKARAASLKPATAMLVSAQSL